jgi:hypothetical protein
MHIPADQGEPFTRRIAAPYRLLKEITLKRAGYSREGKNFLNVAQQATMSPFPHDRSGCSVVLVK